MKATGCLRNVVSKSVITPAFVYVRPLSNKKSKWMSMSNPVVRILSGLKKHLRCVISIFEVQLKSM
jgi:hypothetical protein